ncbi:MAG: serine protease [Deltaproteobacteria bacterium]|nr:MAG: serine protease [Deltaproteobacteria bacterium]
MIISALLALGLTAAVAQDGLDTGDTAAPPVVGGTASPAGKWPAVVALDLGNAACTGTLVGPYTVVSAAHCGSARSVIVNTTDYYSNEGTEYPVARTIIHPNYNPQSFPGGWDIEVIILAQPVVGFEPYGFATDCAAGDVYDGAPATIVGFGLTTQTGTGYNTKLHEATLPIVDADCSEDYYCDQNMVDAGELFAGGDGVDACYGDSGGPLFVNHEGEYVLVGVTSRSGSDATQSYPCRSGGIWTRADTLMDWVQAQTTDVLRGPRCNAPPEVLIYPFGDVGNKGRYQTTYEINDPDSVAWNYDIVQPNFGTITISGDKLIFEGDGSYVGADTFTLIVTDDAGNVVEQAVPLNIVDGKVGCGCNSTPAPASLALGLLALLPLRRRRQA